ncbi:protein DpdE [Bacillus sp. X1(2014)]|uniref:protein DpdE n=1 Tax=Bacillus sp. X1(2014) TaxID=1565991 RepID=UPI0011A9F95A|nr:protein DpdE [Bacillus sp. X1(2014)]
MSLTIGSFVVSKLNKYGTGKVKEISNTYITIEYFKSVADREIVQVPTKKVTPVALQKQTRCYVYHDAQERWVMGRIIRKEGYTYEVHFPDSYAAYINETDIYVRCNVPIEDPSEVLRHKGHDTTFYHVHRSNFVKTILEQRAVTRGMTGLVSSNIQLYQHQVEVVRRVLEDPIPRYLLADEVGLGKTIEAGIIIRQYLLDHKDKQILMIIPPYLLDQWKKEMDEKFKFDYYDDRITWLSTEQIDFLHELSESYGMVVIDEAHEIATKAFHSDENERNDFKKLASLVHQSEGLLLLSATPVLNNEQEFLAMLYLLDPNYYQLSDIDSFKERIAKRQDVGRFLLSFREDTSAFLLKRNVAKLFDYFPNDFIIHQLAEKLQNVLAENRDNDEKRRDLIRRIRVHMSDTYRLHRRLLRNRRESVTDILEFSRDQLKFQPTIHSEYDLDERTPTLEMLLDEWRNEAWASERSVWENQQVESTDLLKIFYLLFESLGTSPTFFQKVIQSRLTKVMNADLLSEKKMLNVELLIQTPLFSGEEHLLEQMLKEVKSFSEDGDRLELLSQIITHTKRKAENQSKKIVVFTGFTSVCKEILTHLKEKFGEGVVSGYHHELNDQQVEDTIEQFKGNDHCTILVCDHTGEIGRNLQFADVLIHFDLPLSPNRLEQRIGRFDRIGRNKPFESFVLVGPDVENSLHEAWYQYLSEGLKIFYSSIASLQFFIDRKMIQVLKQFYIKGNQAIQETLCSISNEIENEKVQIGEQNALDEMEANNPEGAQFYESLIKYEQEFDEIENGLDPWITKALQFEKQYTVMPGFTFKYGPNQDRTLVPAKYLRKLASYMNQPGSYDRDEVLYHSGSSLFRIGDPLIDFLEKYIHWDDRGQTFAYWRYVPGMDSREGMEWAGFALQYVIEGDTRFAKRVLKKYQNTQMNPKALQRIMDHYLPPIYQQMFIDINGKVVDDPTILGHLSKEFVKVQNRGTDLNLTKNRIGIIDRVIPSAYWKETVTTVKEKSMSALKTSKELEALCKEKANFAHAQMEMKLTQLKLRINQEQQLQYKYQMNFNKDLEFEGELTDAILKGILTPKIKLDSIGLIILSGQELRVR